MPLQVPGAANSTASQDSFVTGAPSSQQDITSPGEQPEVNSPAPRQQADPRSPPLHPNTSATSQPCTPPFASPEQQNIGSPSVANAAALPPDMNLVDGINQIDDKGLLANFVLSKLDEADSDIAKGFLALIDKLTSVNATGNGSQRAQETRARTGSAAATKKTFNSRHAGLVKVISRKDAASGVAVDDFTRHAVKFLTRTLLS